MVQRFTNFAESTLQQAVEAGETTLFIDSTEADDFPAPTGGDFFIATIFDQRNSSTRPELVSCTARTGGQLTVTRAQESTAAQAWPAGSRLHMSLSAAVIESLLNQTAVQTSWTGTATGTAAYTLTVVGSVPIPANGDEVVFVIPATNTGNVTLTVTNGITPIGPFPVFNNDGTQLDAGDFAEDFMAVLRWNSTDGAWRVVSLTSAQLIATAINDGPLNPANRISNGDFFQSTAASFSSPASGTETLENVFVFYDGTIGTFSISRQAFAPGQTDVDGDPLFFLRWDHTVAGSGSTSRRIVMSNRVNSGVSWRNGDQAFLSFFAKADSARDITIQLNQAFGSGGSPSADVLAASQLFSLTTSWQRFELLINLPSISGKTLGTNNDHSLSLNFQLPINTNMVIDLAMVQLEAGPRASIPWAQFPIPLQYGGTGFRANSITELGTKLGVLLISNLLTSILAIDGAGSGIDADLLDGLNSTSYVQTSGNQSIAGLKTFTTAINIDSAPGGALVRIGGAAGVARSLFFHSAIAASGQRWSLTATNTAESGSDVGSDFIIARYNDSGIFQESPFTIERSTGIITITDPIRGAAGSAGAPTFSFSGDPNTGIYNPVADQIALVTGGTQRVNMGAGFATFEGTIFGRDGVAGTPAFSFANDTDTGIFSSAANILGFAAGGVAQATLSGNAFSLTPPLRLSDGSAATPAQAFTNDTDSGLYRIGADNLGVSIGGTLRLDFETDRIDLSSGYNIRMPTTTAEADPTDLGYRGTPVVTVNATRTFGRTDAGKTMLHDETTARAWTIDSNANVPFSIGTVIILDNTGNSGGTPGAITLGIATDTLRRGDGVVGTGSRTIPANAVASIRKTKTQEWVITGIFT